MEISRRDLSFLLPMLAAAGARAQDAAAPVETMTSKAFPTDEVLRHQTEERPGVPVVGGLASAAMAPGGGGMVLQ